MKRLTLALLGLVLAFGAAIAQNRPVKGTVIDQNGDPVVGASVVVKDNATVGTVTNIDGQFTLSVPAAAKILVVKFLGSEDAEVEIKPEVQVQLRPADSSLDEVIVVAYGTTKKASFTGSASTIKSEDLSKRKVSNVTKALDGLATGVQTTSGSGQPGAGSSVYIRGLGSINASNTPLYVVDGIPYSGDIASISPNDIETITVLKDAAAGALYGSRGANGVVMVTTKKGKSGVTEVNFKANFGSSGRAIPRYETMGPKDYIEAEYSAFYNLAIDDGYSPAQAPAQALWEMSQGAQKIFGRNEQYNPYNLPIAQLIDPETGQIRPEAQLLRSYDWLDEVASDNAFRQEYTLDLSGGSEKTQHFVSFGYLKDNGYLKTTDYKRYSGRGNVESKPLDWLSVGLASNFSRSETSYLGLSGSSTSNVWYSAQLMGPIFPIYQVDPATGEYVVDEFGNKLFDYGETRPAGQQGDFNSIATLYDDEYDSAINNLSARGHVDFGDTKNGWAKGLKLSFSLGIDYYGLNTLVYYNPYNGNAKNSNGRVTKTSTSLLSYTANQMLSYKFDIADLHHIDAMVAHEYFDLSTDVVSAQKTGFPFGGLYQPDAASTVSDASGYIDHYRIESFLGRINYDYDDKYYLSASLRSDASSRFYKDFRWKSFWSVGGNYRISKEEFMESTTDWLDNLAVKASYGVQGNDAVGSYYAWQALYDLGYSNASEAGALVNAIENKGLSWEKNSNFNAGIDASFWKARLQTSVEWFRRHTTDLLLNYPIPPSTGFDGYTRNSGSMENKGLELTVNGRIIKTQDFEWSATLLFSAIKNKVLKLTEDGKDITSGSRIIREGEAFYSYYLPRSAGVDPLTGEQLYWATVDAEGETVDPYITSSSVLGNASRYVAGNPFPDFYGSFSTQVKYKGFDFSVATGFSKGGKMIDGIYSSTLMSFYYPAQAKHVDLKNAWKHPGDVTTIPRYTLGGTPVPTDDWLIDMSYLSIKNLTFGYSIPQRTAKKWGFKNIRIYAAGDNLKFFTSLRGTDPQNSITGGTDYVYAPTRTLSVGLDIKF